MWWEERGLRKGALHYPRVFHFTQSYMLLFFARFALLLLVLPLTTGTTVTATTAAATTTAITITVAVRVSLALLLSSLLPTLLL